MAARLRRLEDEREIVRLRVRYARACDAGCDAGVIAGLFVAEAYGTVVSCSAGPRGWRASGPLCRGLPADLIPRAPRGSSTRRSTGQETSSCCSWATRIATGPDDRSNDDWGRWLLQRAVLDVSGAARRASVA